MLRSWSLPVSLDPKSGVPIYLQLARAIAGDIQRGRLAPGTSLPGSRVMAETLSIHRNTVTAAYQELEAQGWVQSAASRGTFVSQGLPETAASGGRAIPAEPRYDLPSPLWSLQSTVIPAGALHFTDGTPDARLMPGAALSRAYRRALLKQAKRGLPYSSPQAMKSCCRPWRPCCGPSGPCWLHPRNC
jgi:GntR family transcriptional regulator / MocR family aminotransferase